MNKTKLCSDWNQCFIRLKGKWSSEGMASFGSSFFLVVIAAVVYLVNLTIIAIATRDPHRQRKVGTLNWNLSNLVKFILP